MIRIENHPAWQLFYQRNYHIIQVSQRILLLPVIICANLSAVLLQIIEENARPLSNDFLLCIGIGIRIMALIQNMDIKEAIVFPHTIHQEIPQLFRCRLPVCRYCNILIFYITRTIRIEINLPVLPLCLVDKPALKLRHFILLIIPGSEIRIFTVCRNQALIGGCGHGIRIAVIIHMAAQKPGQIFHMLFRDFSPAQSVHAQHQYIILTDASHSLQLQFINLRQQCQQPFPPLAF